MFFLILLLTVNLALLLSHIQIDNRVSFSANWENHQNIEQVISFVSSLHRYLFSANCGEVIRTLNK
jgi:hypothetical protein